MTDQENPAQATGNKIDQIWAGDLLFRKAEAEDLIAYIESVSQRPVMREDKQAYTIAVDARYGEGKTYFLKRLARQLELTHPVAFVDAWADDIANEPLTALAATLEDALEPFLQSPEIKTKFEDFMSKTGAVAKIAGKGLLRRGVGFLIGTAAVEATEAVLDGASEDALDAIEDAAEELAEDAEAAISAIAPDTLMKQRIKDFRDGQEAIQSMKNSLSALVASLEKSEKQPPIVIVIDELDRCRPTYAIKLLEEIKHLFDVSGLVFVLAIHGEQLGHSVSGAYGSEFDGRAYLRRFIDREYRLNEPNLEKLLERLINNTTLEAKFHRPQIVISGKGDVYPTLAEVVAEYMSIYGLGARDAFQLADILCTSVALARGNYLEAPYFIPVAIGRILNIPPGNIPKPEKSSKYSFSYEYIEANKRIHSEVNLSDMAGQIHDQLGKDWQYYNERLSAGPDYAMRVATKDARMNEGTPSISSPSGYHRLLDSVGRFENPNLA